MKARTENQIKTENHIKELLKNEPLILSRYFTSLSDKTHNTKKMYMNRIIHFVHYMADKNIDINKNDCFESIKSSFINEYLEDNKYKDGKELSDSYRGMTIYALKSFFNFLEDEEYIYKNPCNRISISRSAKETNITVLTQDEIQIIRNNILNGVGSDRSWACQSKWKERDMAIIFLTLNTGLRVGALSEINMEDIDLENSTIRVTEKENITKDIFLNTSAMNVLNDWISTRENLLNEKNAKCDALFISRELKRISAKAINEMIAKYTYNIDKKITAHKLRSTFATNVYETTEDIYITSSLLGHSSVETTKRYANISRDKKIKALNAIDNL